MKRILREPLLHFAVIGALFFALYRWENPSSGDAGEPADEIVVTAGQIGALAQNFVRIWQRPPSPAELDSLIDDFVTEEIFYREALALGLDRDDVIIRRRLRQKLEFLSRDVTSLPEPVEADLRAYLQEHAEAFRQDAMISFKQVYLNPDRRGETLEEDVRQLLALLRRNGPDAEPAGLGDRIMLDAVMLDASQSQVSRLFGEEFMIRLMQLPVGEWTGPVRSAYGDHVVVVTGRTDGRLPELEEVRDMVRREWEHARQEEAYRNYTRSLRNKYIITIENPAGPEAVEPP